MHGPTFMANPLACAVAIQSIQLLVSQDWHSQIQRISQQLKQKLMPLVDYAQVEDVRVLGAIGVVEMRHAVDMRQIQALCLKYGIWIRPFGKLIYIMPPFIINEQELEQLLDGMVEIVQFFNIH